MLQLSHKNLDVWKASVSFVSEIYKLTENFPKTELYGIVNQIRRASVSIPSNIAEGASRNSLKDRNRFYIIARSSLVELDTQLEISMHLKYCSEEQLISISEEMNHIFAMLSKMMKKGEMMKRWFYVLRLPSAVLQIFCTVVCMDMP